MIDKTRLRELPRSPGVYIYRNGGGKIIYNGKANNLRRRIASYFRADVEPKVRSIVRSLRHIDYVLALNENEALVIERQLINRYKPYYNSMWRDDKSYPYLRLSLNEDFPRLFFTRKLVKDGSEYFGPYPQLGPIKSTLRWLQKMFGWRPCALEFGAGALPAENKVKSCLYFQTGRCPGPCMGKITPEDYRKRINELRLFLKGKYSNLRRLWEQEMRHASDELNYEKAADLRDRIITLERIDEKISVRELKPEDLAASLKITEALEDLKNVLGLAQLPVIIEGFDISNISGTESVGSMVRFHNARPDKDNYRRFKIKTVTGPNDVAMIKEVVYRRYRRLSEEQRTLPDLILIDGGRNQLSAAMGAIGSLKLKIDIVSLAKKHEEILMPGWPGPLKLSRSSPALQTLQAVRDEAHRFAISYHRLRRSKNLLQ